MFLTHLWEMPPWFKIYCRICIIVSTSPMKNASFLPHLLELHHCSISLLGKASLSLPQLWEMEHSLYLTSKKFIIVCLHFTCWKYITVLTLLWEMHYCFHLTCRKCLTFTISTEGNVSLSPPYMCEIRLWLYLIYCKCIMVSTSPVGNSSLYPSHLWEMPPCVYLSCGKCIIVSTSHASFLYLKFGKCTIVSTSPVGNISLSPHNLWDIHHCLHFTWV